MFSVASLIFCLPWSLSLFSAVIAGSHSHKLKHYESAHADAFHNDLLKQLADSRLASVSGSSSSPQATGNASLGDLTLTSVATGHTFAVDATDSLQIYTNDNLPTDPAPSSACAAALMVTIPCNSTVSLMGLNPYFLMDDLSSVCTTDCSVGLESYRAQVVSACSGYSIAGSGNISYTPTLAVDSVLGPYSVQCLQDPQTSQFCGPTINNYNATDGLLTLPTAQLCSYCTLETLNITLSNPLTYQIALEDLLSSAISVCGSQFDDYNVTRVPGAQVVLDPGASAFGANLTTEPTIQCALSGRNVTANSETTCAAVAAQYSISEYSVLTSNPFLANCTIPAETALCVPPACTTYTIATNDTCDSVAALASSRGGQLVTTIQLQSFNPDLGSYCQLMALRIGKQICLSPNGGWPDVGASSDANPSATPTTFASVPSPTVSGTTSDCGRWYQVQSGDICNTVALSNSVSLDDFLVMNPEVDANCTNLWLDYYYCVAPYPPFVSVTASPTITTNYSSATIFTFTLPTNYSMSLSTVSLTQAGVTAPTNVAAGTRTVACGAYYTIQDGDTLDSVATLVNVNATQLASWNPELGSGALPPSGQAICIRFPRAASYTLMSVPRPTNAYANATQLCAQYYTVQDGDGCGSIASEFGLTGAQLTALNPGLKSDCTNLILGIAYCVFPTYPLSQVTAPGGIPDNVAPGTITANCTDYYTVVSGDGCGSIESKFNLTSQQFFAYNPEVKTDCSNLLLGDAYCVQSTTPVGGGSTIPSNVASGTITDGCSEYYTVVSGDGCGAIESKFGLTSQQFLTYNPEIKADCTNLELGAAYCVQSTTPVGGGSTIPSNVATGTITDGCSEYYTVVSGDGCGAIESKFGLTSQQFLTYNPEIKADCTNLELGAAYCTQSTLPVGGSSGPPSNLANGSLTNCTSYYTVVSGDSCVAIEGKLSLAARDFFEWNPEVSAPACTNIQLGAAYCSAGGGNQCGKTYTVQSGDFCFAITQSQGITQAQLQALNPFLDANCDLSVGEILCVG